MQKKNMPLWLFILVFLLGLKATGQEKKPKAFSYKGGYGFLIPHRKEMQYIGRQHTQRHEIRYDRNTFGNQPWHKRYNYPSVSTSLTYYSLNNQTYFGSVLALSSGFTFKLIEKKRLSFKLGTQAGLGFVEKPFDAEKNYKNIAIGSQFNVYFFIQPEFAYRFSPSWELSLSASFSHFSNTAFALPNLGINLPHANLGISRSFGKVKNEVDSLSVNFKPTAFWGFQFSAGLNEAFPIDGPQYFATNLSLSRLKRFTPSSSAGLSADFFYNPAQKASLENKNIFIDSGYENLQVGISLYHRLHFGSFGVWTQAGYYLKSAQKEWGNLYQMVGVSLDLGSRWLAYCGMKTHLASAEYSMLGIRYELK